MKKKGLMILISILLIAVFSVSFVACDKEEVEVKDDSLTIVYLGDSIAEAIVGPSPLSERDNYGYYAILGKINNYDYYNISISGHKTSGGMAGTIGLRELIEDPTENGMLYTTRLKQADIISISILGNNVLQYNLGTMVAEVKNPDWFKSTDWYKYEQWKTDDQGIYKDVTKTQVDRPIFDVLAEGGLTVRPTVTANDDFTDYVIGAGTEPFDFPKTTEDLEAIIGGIQKLNPTAKILFQKVYNPVFDGTTLLTKPFVKYLNCYYDTTDSDIRNLKVQASKLRTDAQVVLNNVNKFLDEYLVKHPGAFEILDIREEFEKVASLDQTNQDNLYTSTVGSNYEFNLDDDSWGRKCIYPDYTHPSNMGHAYIADATQRWLVENGYADANYVANYKAIRVDQINRLYKNVTGFDATAAIAKINAATTFTDVTEAYFRAVDGYMPIYC